MEERAIWISFELYFLWQRLLVFLYGNIFLAKKTLAYVD